MVTSSGFHCDQLATIDGALYMQAMVRRGRLVVVRDLQGVAALCTFFLCSSMGQAMKFYRKHMWEIVDDDPQGYIAYIDKLVARDWNITMRKMVQEALLMRHPHVRCAVWMRPTEGRDRSCVYIRKGGLQDVAKV